MISYSLAAQHFPYRLVMDWPAVEKRILAMIAEPDKIFAAEK